ncbi:MAG: hypothetical protein ACTSVG_09340 [Alphaproteobacteria bacterium]
MRQEWTGTVDFFVTGAPLAGDSGDSGDSVDMSVQPASVAVLAGDIPASATLVKAYLFWAGTMANNACAATPNYDDAVTFTAPGQLPVAVLADNSYCSDGGAASYDVQSHRADVTQHIGSLTGTSYTVDNFVGQWSNGATDNASFSVVLVYEEPSLPHRTVALYDGLETFLSSSRTFTQSNVALPASPAGDLAWHVLDGDIAGDTAEKVEVGSTNATLLPLWDADNPASNPMNRTINTTSSVNTVGVDIDAFPIDGGLSAGDSELDVTFSAGTDKWWLAHFVIGIDITLLPEIEVSLVSGPLADDGFGTLVPFDVNGDTFIDGADEGNLIGVELSHAQYFTYEIEFENTGVTGSLDVLTFLDTLPDGFRLSAFAEDALVGCVGTDCDGVVEGVDCIVTVSGPAGKKNVIDPRYVTVEPDGLEASALCTTTVFVETTNGGGKGKKAGTFVPKACEIADTSGGTLTNTVTLNDGVMIFDAATSNLLAGPIGSIQLAPQACP